MNTPELLLDQSKVKYYREMAAVMNKYYPKSTFNPFDKESILENPQFKVLMNSFPGAMGIIELASRNYLYASDSFRNLLGYGSEYVMQGGFERTIAFFPPSHQEIFIHKIIPGMFQYMEKYEGEVKNLRFSYNTMLKCMDGSHRWFLHQLVVIHKDEDGTPMLLLKIISDIHDFKKDNSITLSISERDQYGFYKIIFTENHMPGPSTLSKREQEILSLISMGKSSKEIAECLFISEETVYKHRKNMLKKLEVKRSGELIKKAYAFGMI